jgi:hypothetical protein
LQSNLGVPIPGRKTRPLPCSFHPPETIVIFAGDETTSLGPSIGDIQYERGMDYHGIIPFALPLKITIKTHLIGNIITMYIYIYVPSLIP